MPASLKAGNAIQSRPVRHAKPVDLVQLGIQTMGDHALECEVLAIFRSQAPIHLNAILAAGNPDVRRRAAHTLKGAARAIGAWDLAALAELAEQPAFGGDEALSLETARVCEFIHSIV